MEKKRYDLIIIGGGGSGLSAAMYAGRLGLSVLVLGHSNGSELPIGGVITTTNIVDNYPGILKDSGMQIAKKLEAHARVYDEVEIKTEKVIKVSKIKTCFSVKTEKASHSSKAIIFATGTKWRKLDIPGAGKYERRGVNYCALCDGPLFKNKIAAVIGGSDTAAKDALILAEYAKKVYIIYRGENIRPEPINMEKIKSNKKIEIINNTNLKEVKGNSLLNSIVLDKPYKGSNILKLDGIFVAIGHIVLSDLPKELGVKINKKGEVIIDHATAKTNLQGVFASGDVTDKPFKQLITGVADGVTAAYSAYEYVTKEFIETCD